MVIGQINDDPEIAAIDDQNMNEDETHDVAVSATDIDSGDINDPSNQYDLSNLIFCA